MCETSRQVGIHRKAHLPKGLAHCADGRLFEVSGLHVALDVRIDVRLEGVAAEMAHHLVAIGLRCHACHRVSERAAICGTITQLTVYGVARASPNRATRQVVLEPDRGTQVLELPGRGVCPEWERVGRAGLVAVVNRLSKDWNVELLPLPIESDGLSTGRDFAAQDLLHRRFGFKSIVVDGEGKDGKHRAED